MFVAFRRQHPAFFRLADEAEPDEVTFKHLDALPGQSHLRGDDVETHSAFSFTENLKVSLLDGIQAEAVDLLGAAHGFDVSLRYEIGSGCRRLTFR